MHDFEKTQGPALRITSYVFGSLSILAVVLRLVSRYIKRMKCGWDDWTILLALMIWLIFLGLELRGWMTLLFLFMQTRRLLTWFWHGSHICAVRYCRWSHGSQLYYLCKGTHLSNEASFFTVCQPESRADSDCQYIYACAPFYCLAIGPANISVLLLYRRIFDSDWCKHISRCFTIALVLWTFTGTIGQARSCKVPLWKVSKDSECILYGAFWLTIMVVELFIECLTLLLPVNQVCKWIMSKKLKLTVIGMFSLGGWYVPWFFLVSKSFKE